MGANTVLFPLSTNPAKVKQVVNHVNYLVKKSESTALSDGKLANQAAIRHYLSYTVKIMELSSKYDLKSILL